MPWENDPPGKSSVAWDTEAALRMREEGKSFAAIARAVGTSANCVKQYARRHWRGEG